MNATIRTKAEFYKSKEIAVHISTADRFYNGLIIDVSEERLILLDEKLGEMFLLFCEIKFIEPREVEK